MVAVALAGGLFTAASGCAAEPPSPRERLIQDLKTEPQFKDYSDKQVECLADAYIKYAKPEAIELIMQGKTPADSGWKDGVDGRTLTRDLAACNGPIAPSPTG
ncbi:hypothetical protein ACU635_18555 [[Actinomadura] parvosata]|uniref:hypothetical protein n=1 Tax=[Actinomadura] parvosata TaxID=1955412 RepID=UPI00406BFECB